MAKKRRSVSISEENHEYLKNHPNASQLIDELVTEYREGGGENNAVLRYRLEDVETEIASLEARVEKKRELKQSIESRFERRNDKQQRVVEEAVAYFEGNEIGQAPAEHWANKADMSIDEFLEAYNEVREE